MPGGDAGEGPKRGRGVPLSALWHAFDEARFGAARTLNLRESLPTADEAARRTEAWLRQKQVEGAGEVLVITGRGNASPGGVSAVREAAIRLFYSLKRGGVVAGHEEHTPGSFVVTLAPVRQLYDAPKRRRGHAAERARPAAPASLDALDPETRAMLRNLAERSLEALGMRAPDHETHVAFLEREMLKQFGALARSVPEGPDREARLRAAVARAMEEYE